VKGGGHATNPGFSSTKGVQIALARFNETKVNSEDRTVEVGPGLTWDQVYTALNSTGVNVIGGRIPGIGVAGLTLGGGKWLMSRPVVDFEISQVIHISLASTDWRLITSRVMSLSSPTVLSKL
jgi:hypothetical protein